MQVPRRVILHPDRIAARSIVSAANFSRNSPGSNSRCGILFATAAAAAARGPIATGFIYDRAGSYALAWFVAVGFNALALALLAFTRPPDAPTTRGSASLGP